MAAARSPPPVVVLPPRQHWTLCPVLLSSGVAFPAAAARPGPPVEPASGRGQRRRGRRRTGRAALGATRLRDRCRRVHCRRGRGGRDSQAGHPRYGSTQMRSCRTVVYILNALPKTRRGHSIGCRVWYPRCSSRTFSLLFCSARSTRRQEVFGDGGESFFPRSTVPTGSGQQPDGDHFFYFVCAGVVVQVGSSKERLVILPCRLCRIM